jgi:hypothetical protein
MDHCVAKVAEIVARGEPDLRSVFQLGYNLGRLSELTGLGREPFWDRWKDAVARWDEAELGRLARQLQSESGSWRASDESPAIEP